MRDTIGDRPHEIKRDSSKHAISLSENTNNSDVLFTWISKKRSEKITKDYFMRW